MANGQQNTNNNTKDNAPRKDSDAKDDGSKANESGKSAVPQRDSGAAPQPSKDDSKRPEQK